jgi:exosome complex component RRP42
MTSDMMKKHLIEAISKGVRRDGRALDEFREVTIERGVSSTAHGSARVTAGAAEVVAGVKIEINRPYPDRPDEGGLMVSAEMLPLSHRKFEGGPPGMDSIEAARVVDRTIRESGTIDAKKLVVEEGEKAWFVGVDLMPVSFDGNMIDLGAIAAMAALQDARIPVLKEDGQPDLESLTDEKLPLSQTPIAVTVFKYGDKLLVDPTEEEERMYDSRLTVATLDNGKLCAMQKGGDGPLTMEDIEKMIELSLSVGKKLRGVLNG